MSTRVHAHLRSNVVGYLTLFAFTAAATALAIPASAAAVTAAVEGGKLVVTGGDGVDKVALGHGRWDPEGPLYYFVSDVEGSSAAGDVTAGNGCFNPSGAPWGEAYCSTAVTSVTVSVAGGADDVSVWCSGERTIADPLRVAGGGGNDNLGGATEGSRVTLLGAGGRDGLTPSGCSDAPYSFPITAKGGTQTDVLRGSCNGEDSLFGQDGGDFFFTKDGNEDLVDGGAGSDTAEVDRKDVKQSIENNDPRNFNFC